MDSKTFLIPALTPEDARILAVELEQIDGVRDVQIHQPTHSVSVVWTSPARWDDIASKLWKLNLIPDLPQSF